MAFGPISRQRKGAPVDDEKKSHLQSSRRPKEEYGSSYHVWAQPSSFSEHGSRTAGYVPNLTGQVDIARYRPVFEGTYSSVYLGTYGSQEFAIKAIRTINRLEGTKRKFRRELETWWSLRHPNILSCMGYIEAERLGEYGAIISPWCKNGNASDYLAGNPPHSHRVKMFLDVARGLCYLHHLNPTVIHGDLKPANILIDEAFNAKICDFGLARLIQENGSHTGLTTATYTGTARYLAYELVEYEELPTKASDVHALGCIGLEFIFSKIPYAHIPNDRGNAYFKIGREIAQHVPPAVRPDVLEADMLGLWSLLESCWQVQIDRRSGVDDIVHYLERYCSRIYVKKSGMRRAYHHRTACPHPGVKSPDSSLQPMLDSPVYLNVTLFFPTVLFIALLRFTTL